MLKYLPFMFIALYTPTIILFQSILSVNHICVQDLRSVPLTVFDSD